MRESWHPILGFEHYEVSDLGRVRSLDRQVWNGRVFCAKQGRVLASRLDKDGYCLVDIYQNKKPVTCKVHRLVAVAFLPNPQGLPEVDHRNFDRTDNKVGNLRWISRIDNTRHALSGGRALANPPRTAVIGTDGTMRHFFASVSEAERLGFHRGSIHRCLLGLQSQHRGFRWEYA